MPVESRTGNLFEPVSGGTTHGIFDARARPRSYQLWATTHRPVVAATAAAFAAAVAGMSRMIRG